MDYIPPQPKWYVAELVEEFLLEDNPNNVIHINMILVRADSPNEAYDRAIWFGGGKEDSYKNTEGKNVTVKFHGLKSLSVVNGDLDDGTVLTWEEKVGVPEAEIRDLICKTKEELGAFRPTSDTVDGDQTDVIG